MNMLKKPRTWTDSLDKRSKRKNINSSFVIDEHYFGQSVTMILISNRLGVRMYSRDFSRFVLSCGGTLLTMGTSPI
jgi:hypothetical protein